MGASSSLRRRATDIVFDAAPRTHVKSVHADSQDGQSAALPVHTDSRPLRIDVKREFLANVSEARTRLGWSVESMAEIVGCATSLMCDALNGKRNFPGHWITALGPDFETAYNQVVDEKRGNSPQAKRARAARNLGDLVHGLVSRLLEDLE